ncbi:MAG: hypothetical protein AAGK98_12485 [Pseudomonadota bacterium]
MTIAIIGWGSLIWDLDDLAPKVAGPWQMSAGPEFPLEFSRISDKRKQALAVCIDPEHGAPCPTHCIASIRGTVREAMEDLAARERAPLARIGFVTAAGAASRLPAAVRIARDWLADSRFDAAVWTDLEPVFEARTGVPFSVPEAKRYLRSLEGESLAEAHRYISEAPEGTRTPLRTALERDLWWRRLGTD